jgi:hypothetical protein
MDFAHGVVAALILVVSPLATAAPAAAAAPAGTATELYRKAFEELRSPIRGEDAALDDVATSPLDGEAARVLAARQPVLDLLRRAATLPPAAEEDSGLGPDRQPAMNSLSAARRGASLLRLRARLAMREDRPADAVEDVLAAIALARHVGHQKVLVVRLVEIGTETPALDQLATMLPRLPDDVVTALPRKLAALPRPVTGKETMLAEFAFARRAARKTGVDVEQTDALKPFYAAVGDAMEKAPAEFAKVVDSEAKKFEGNPYAGLVAPSLKKVHEPMAALEAKRAMLGTAVNVRLNGAGAVRTSRDPFGDGPFTHEATEGGFVLGSKLVVRGQPVTLSTSGPQPEGL